VFVSKDTPLSRIDKEKSSKAFRRKRHESRCQECVDLFKIRMKGADVDSVIRVIENRKLMVLKKTWHCTYHDARGAVDDVWGVYIFSPLDALGFIGVTVILEFRKESRNCDITAVSLGEGGTQDLIGGLESSIKGDLIKLASSKDWIWEEANADYNIIQCPHCLSMHSPLELKVDEYGTIECNNCGQEFALEDVPDIRKDDYSRVECPFCGCIEDYKYYQVSWDRKVSCLNCAKTIALDEARRHPTQHYFGNW
jgi:hypothetical protein